MNHSSIAHRAGAPAPAPRSLAIDAAASALRYQIVHRLHRVHGCSSGMQGRAIVQPDGKVVAGVLAPVASFRSGDADRDARTVEVLGAFVVFKGEATLPRGDGCAQVTMRGELTLHAVRRPISVPLTVEFEESGRVRVRGAFEVSLEAHAVERPSLLLMKVEDACRIELDLVLRDERPRAAASAAAPR